MFYWQLPDGRYRVRVSRGSGRKRMQLTRTVETFDDIKPKAQELAAELGVKIREHKSGWVYFIQNRDGYIKIGWTGQLMERLQSYMTTADHTGGRCEVLALVKGTRKDEAYLHWRFKYCRAKGRELYSPHKHLTNFIDNMLGKNRVIMKPGPAYTGRDGNTYRTADVPDEF